MITVVRNWKVDGINPCNKESLLLCLCGYKLAAIMTCAGFSEIIVLGLSKDIKVDVPTYSDTSYYCRSSRIRYVSAVVIATFVACLSSQFESILIEWSGLSPNNRC